MSFIRELPALRLPAYPCSPPPKADVESHAGGASEEVLAAAEDVYRQWLRRQYAAYTTALLGLLASPAVSAGVQVRGLVGAAHQCTSPHRSA